MLFATFLALSHLLVVRVKKRVQNKKKRRNENQCYISMAWGFAGEKERKESAVMNRGV